MNILAINWSDVGSQILQLILSLSILVIIHEFGHYITAVWFKCRVEKFYLFFDPWFSILKKKVGDTEYGVGWLPLGGYVKIAGMVDESMDKEQLKLPAQPHEFRSKPAWQRLIIMLAGVIMNMILAFIIYAMVLFVWGQQKVLNASVQNGIHCADSLVLRAGLQHGDKIKSVDGETVEYFDDLPEKILLGKSVEVDRNGSIVKLNMPVAFLGELAEKKKKGVGFLELRKPSIVGDNSDKFFDTTNAKKAGLRHKDKIVAIDSIQVNY
jgi:regulator of sigma E protease